MTLSRIGRISKAFVVSMAVVLGMSACGGYTVGFMWVLGTQYNQVSGFKIDDYTGNLTNMVNSPYTSGGVDPTSIAVRVGGNFVFVVNKGTSVAKCDGNVSVFAVGEDGVLTFQESYQTAGCSPVWVTADSTGNFVYVLDSQSPAYGTTTNGVTDLNGDITVFSVDGNTGRLQIIPNQLIKNAAGQQLNYFEVGPAPTMLREGGNCLYALDTGDQSVYPYGVGGSGQLTVEVNSTVVLGQAGTTNFTSLNVTGSNIYITDAGAAGSAGRIIPFTAAAGCSLAAQVDGPVANISPATDPVFSLTDSKGKFLYVLNNSSSDSNNTYSSISAYVIETTGALVPISDPENPYPVGSGPNCMVEDPSDQYVYTSNYNGTVTGKFINQNTGQLSGLARGSTFPSAGIGTCLAVSGNVD